MGLFTRILNLFRTGNRLRHPEGVKNVQYMTSFILALGGLVEYISMEYFGTSTFSFLYAEWAQNLAVVIIGLLFANGTATIITSNKVGLPSKLSTVTKRQKVAKGYPALTAFKDVPDLKLFRWFWIGEDRTGQVGMTPGTFIKFWGGYLTARHVVEEMAGNLPEGVEGDRRTGRFVHHPSHGVQDYDYALIGVRIPNNPPLKPREGMRLQCLGWPGGCTGKVERRKGTYYINRHSGSHIAIMDEWEEPVFRGMSGGLVLGLEGNTWNPVGILVVRNSPVDFDDDGIWEHSYDFVSLYDIWCLETGKRIED